MAQHEQFFTYNQLLSGEVFANKKPFRTLVWLFRGNLLRLLLAYVFFIIKHSPAWVVPIIIANIVDLAVTPTEDPVRTLWLNLAIGLVVVVQNVLTAMLYNRLFSRALRDVEAKLRSNLVRKLQMLSISFYKRFESGRIQSKIIRDVEGIVVLARQISNGMVPILISMVIVLGITLYKKPVIALFFAASIPISFLLVRSFRKNIRTGNRDYRCQLEKMSSQVSDMVEMLPVTKAHGLEEVEISRINHSLKRIRDIGYQLDMTTTLFGASSWITMQSMQLVCLGFTGYLVLDGQMEAGAIVLFQTYFTQLLNQVNSLINIYPEMMKGFESIRSVSEIFLSDDVEDFSGKQKLREVRGDIRLEQVTVRYPDSAAPSLEGIDLHIREGERIAVVGESGSGKSTLLSLIVGFIHPNEGRILLDGHDFSELHLPSLRQQIAFVPQNVILLPGTIRENITYGMRDVSEEALQQAVRLAYLEELLARLPDGLDTKLGQHGDTLSGGEKQRVTIARAMIRNPRVVILDEATSALDSVSEAHIQQALEELTKGRTTITAAHRLRTIRAADRVILLQQGKLSEQGSYEELIKRKGLFYRFQNLQA